jgi:hypothetical protein
MMNDTLKINGYRRGYKFKSCYNCKNVINKIHYYQCSVANYATVHKDYVCCKYLSVIQISIEIDYE